MKKKTAILLLIALITASLNSCASVELPEGIYDTPSQTSSYLEKYEKARQESYEILLATEQPYEANYFVGWEEEEIERYKYMDGLWDKFFEFRDILVSTDDEETLIETRDEIYKLIEPTNSKDKEYKDWVEKYSDRTNKAKVEQRYKVIGPSLHPPLDSLRSFFPYDAEYDFNIQMDMYYSEFLTLAISCDKEIYYTRLKQLDQIQKNYDKGIITAQEGVNAILNL